MKHPPYRSVVAGTTTSPQTSDVRGVTVSDRAANLCGSQRSFHSRMPGAPSIIADPAVRRGGADDGHAQRQAGSIGMRPHS